MFGLFKKTLSPTELGETLFQHSSEFIQKDCLRGVVSVIDPDFDYSTGADVGTFLDEHITRNNFRGALIAFHHAAFHAACHQAQIGSRRATVKAAVSCMNHDGTFYKFDTLYDSLEPHYEGTAFWGAPASFGFDERMSPPPHRYPADNAKALLLGYVPYGGFKSKRAEERYGRFYGTCATAMSTAVRALDHIGREWKIQ